MHTGGKTLPQIPPHPVLLHLPAIRIIEDVQSVTAAEDVISAVEMDILGIT